jgi:glutamine amidotransferase
MVVLVDYGAGNLTSVRKGFEAAGAGTLRTVDNPHHLRGADAIVVPGVGHFDATRTLKDDWRGAIRDLLALRVPLFGICLGMQWLFAGSEEAPDVPGLGAIEGRCTRLFHAVDQKVPHVGWNTLNVSAPGQLLRGVPDGSHVYFTHSYAAPVTPAATATATHGSTFAAVVEAGPMYGVQFHPEKSGATGLRILRNFVEVVRAR